MTSRSEPDPPVVRPRRQIRPPAHLADYQVHGSGFVKRVPSATHLNEVEIQAAALTSENASRSSSPQSQPSYGDDLVLRDVWPEPFEDVSPEQGERHLQIQQLSDIKYMWFEMKRDNDELRSHILPEIMSTLHGLKTENASLRKEIQQFSTSFETPGRSATPIPAPRTHLPPSVCSRRSSAVYADEVPQPRPAPCEQLTRHMEDLTVSPRMTHPEESHHTPIQRSYTYSAQPAGTGQYDSVMLDPRHSHLQRERGFSLPSRPQVTPRKELLHVQEQIYRGPKPTIPSLTAVDPRQFSRLRMALENLLPADASERFKYQILTDHLELEEALLVADSYCNSVRPYTDTMQALVKMYGQPHRLVLRSIAEVLEGPNLKPETTHMCTHKVFSKSDINQLHCVLLFN